LSFLFLTALPAPVKALKQGKTTLFVPLQEKRGKKFAPRILFVLLYWRNWCYGICSMRPALWRLYEDIFRAKMNTKRTADRKKQAALRRKQIAQAERRIAELSKLFKRMYEDNGRVGPAVTGQGPSQNRTCPIKAYGSSVGH